MQETVFIISGHHAIRDLLAELVASAGLRAEFLRSLEALPENTGREPPGCLILDTCPDDLATEEQRATFAATCDRIPVLMLIERGDVPTAVQALKLGAADLLERPFRGANLLERLERVVAKEGCRRATT